jgi:hypothetical protein
MNECTTCQSGYEWIRPVNDTCTLCGVNRIRDIAWWLYQYGEDEPCYECPNGRYTDPSDIIHDTWLKCKVTSFCCCCVAFFLSLLCCLSMCY